MQLALQDKGLLVLKVVVHYIRYTKHSLGARYATELLIELGNATFYWPRIDSCLYYDDRDAFREQVDIVDKLHWLFNCRNHYSRRLPFQKFTIVELVHNIDRLVDAVQATPDLLKMLHNIPTPEMEVYMTQWQLRIEQ